MPIKPGDVVAGRFALEAVAGSGGMGEVFRALDRHTNAPVAVKVLRVGNPAVAARFEREARVLASLRHPGIVRYVAHGVTGSQEPYLAMEWLDGEDLQQRLAREPISGDDALALIRAAASALTAAHERGVVHRDIKPANLFLLEGNPAKVKIVDFGVARLAEATQILTRSGNLIGTPAYMSPEQAKGELGIGPPTDVYAIGAVLFECFAGHPPFVAKHPFAVLTKIVFEKTPRLSEVSEAVAPEIDELVAAMMAKSAEDRPQLASIADSLRHLKVANLGRATRAPAAATSLSESEQRLLSVVVARLVTAEADTVVEAGDEPLAHAATAAGGHSDGEFGDELRGAVEPFGAKVERLLDGSFVALLTGPGAATDLAARSARCALAMRRVFPHAAIAVATGRAVFEGRLPVGDAVDRAVDLLASSASTIRIDTVTAGLLPTRFVVRSDATGFALEGESDKAPSVRTLLGKPTTCVGRERELAVLRGVFEECVEDEAPGAAVVLGDAGIGKSRVRYEFLRRLEADGEPLRVLLARGDPMSAGAPFGLLGKALRQAMSIREGEPLQERRQKVLANTRERFGGADDAERVALFLGELIGTPFADDDSVELRSARQDARLMGDQMTRAWESWLATECAAQPVLLILEDLHWGDLPTVRYVDAALRNLDRAPLMVLALGRPEVRTLFPDLWAGRRVQEVRLAGLRRRAGAKLVREVLGDRVSNEEVDRMVERAAGNAFFLEELVRAAAEAPQERLPETILTMIQARLERLPDRARRVLRAASVFGQSFWEAGVDHLLRADHTAGDTREWLALLEDHELIQRRRESRLAGESELTFRQDLIRSAARASLTDDDKRVGHRLAAEWLQAAGESDAVVVAEHYERGGDTERAAELYRTAAVQALGGNDFASAIERAERGLAGSPSGERRGALLMVQADAYAWMGQTADAVRVADEAMRGASAGSDLWCGAARKLVSSAVKAGNKEKAVSVANALLAGTDPNQRNEELTEQQTRALADASGYLLLAGEKQAAEALFDRVAAVDCAGLAPEIAASIFATRATRAAAAGDLAEFTILCERVTASYEETGDRRRACSMRGNIGHGYMELGALDEAEKVLRQAIDEADDTGIVMTGLWAKSNLGKVLARAGQLDEACRLQQEVLDAVPSNQRRLEIQARTYLAAALAQAEQLDRAASEARTAAENAEFSRAAKARALATLADILLRRRQHTEALSAANDAMQILDSTALDEGELHLRAVHARALWAAGDRDGAAAAIRTARDTLSERADTISDSGLRRSFLDNVPENAEIIALADAWLQATAGDEN